LPIYRSQRFGVLVALSCVVGILLLTITISSIFSFFPIRRITAYYQLINYDSPISKPSPTSWARLNHTVLKLGDATVESVFMITMISNPPYERVAVEIGFDDPWTYTEDDPAPQIQSGNQSWSGRAGADLQVNQTITIYTKLDFNFDAKYAIKCQVANYDPVGGSNEGLHTIFYITVEQGKIISVTDESGQIPPSNTLESIEFNP